MRLATSLLIASAGIDALFTTTRGAFALQAVRLFALFAVRGRVDRKTMRPIFVAVLLTVLVWPFVSRLRYARTETRSLESAVSEARRDSGPDDQSSWEKYIDPVLQRFTGMNSLIPIVKMEKSVSAETVVTGFTSQFFGGLGDTVTTFNTQVIWGISPNDPMGIATSLLGWFYLAGGEVLEVLGPAVLLLLIGLVWRWLARGHLRGSSVFQAQLSILILVYFSEGNVDAVLPLLATIGSTAVLEVLLRTMDRMNRRGRAQGGVALPLPMRSSGAPPGLF